MMRWIVGSSLKFRFMVVAFAGGMMLFGFTQLRNTPLDVFPEFAPPLVEIQTISLGLSSKEVESLVTVPLEEALNGVAGLETIRSKSVADLSSIELLFEPGTDLLTARQLVSERVQIVTPSLPTWASPPVMMPPVSATRRVMHVGLSSDSVPLIELSTIAYWKIRARLLRVPGVANVAIWGERLQQQHVQVIPKRLRQLDVTLDDVMTATADALDAGLLRYSDGAVIGTGGALATPNQELSIRHVLSIASPEDLAKVVVGEHRGEPILLDDVANVVIDHQPLSGDAVVGEGPGLLLVVEKFPWANTLEVTKGVEQALDEMAPGLPGVEIDSYIFRAANFVDDALDNLSHSLLLGILLMVLVLGAFLFDWRSALISAITIPLSLTAAALVLYLRGATINTMILAGFVIALGAVVDDAIVDIENIVRRLRLHRKVSDDRSVATTAKIIFDASLEVRGAVVYASMIEALALLPIFFLESLTGSFFRPLAGAYALAVVVSTLMALIVTPALAMILLRKAPLEKRESPLVVWLQRGYDRMLAPIIRSPKPAYVTVGALMALGVVALPLLGQSLLPTFRERDFLMHWVSAPGTSVGEEARIVTQASHELAEIPGVRSFGSHIGQAFLSEEIAGVNFGENWISIDPSAPFDETVAAVDEVIEGYPGLFRNRETYLNERIDEVLAGSSDAIVVRIFGDDLKVLRAKADEVVKILRDIDGVVEQHAELQVDIPQIEIDVNLAAAEHFGLKPGDIRRASATMLASEEVGDIFRDGKAYDIHVFSTPASRDALSDVGSMMIDTPDGGHVRLEDVADVRIIPLPNNIHREEFSRTIDVGANVEGRDLGSVVGELEDRLASVEFPLGVHAEVLGEFEERQAAQGRLLGFAALAIVGIFLILLASFGSVRLATLAFVTLPMALVGGVLAAYFGGGIISIGSLVGFFTVLGIVARNGIMMVSHYRHLEEHEGMTFGPELVARGSRERLAPILMTALTTGLALVPLVLSGNLPGQEIEYPMGIVILGGLITTTLLNLFVLPSLYLRFGQARASSRPRVAIASLAVLLAFVSWGCSNASTATTSVSPADSVQQTPENVVGAHDFDPANFSDPTTIDNRWFPLIPGTQFTWEGHAFDEGERVERAVVFTVTDLTKVIDGVRTRVAWDRDYNDGVREEMELAFFAQDDDGNVWHFGEYPEEWDDNQVVKTPTWIAGVEGALEGIRMRAVPELGTPSYAEGWGPAVNWDDRGRVHGVGERACVPVDCYSDVVVIDEFSRSEPGAFQLKYYAAGVGGVEIGWRGPKEEEQEVMVLVKLLHLTPEQMTIVRSRVLAQEARAYELSKDVYGKTAPIEV